MQTISLKHFKYKENDYYINNQTCSASNKTLWFKKIKELKNKLELTE